MKIELSQYNPEWPLLFEKEKLLLQHNIGQWLVGSIEHVGSTAVSGMLAKPIIDIMFGVHSLAASEAAIPRLEEIGYCYYPYKPDVMHWFCKPSPDFRTHHLHLIPFQSPLWQERLTFRNRLRENPAIAHEYSALKKYLALKMPLDREAYTDGKWPFIKRVLQDATASS